MTYTTINKDNELECSHPKVKSIHRWGGGSKERYFYFATITFENRERKDFEYVEYENVVTDIENYLKSLEKNL